MIRVGMMVMQTIYCPSCAVDTRCFEGSGTNTPTVVCRNKNCKDKDILFQVDRMRGIITEVWPKEASDAELGKTHAGR